MSNSMIRKYDIAMKAVVFALLTQLAGCAVTKPTNFYVLQAAATGGDDEIQGGELAKLGVGPIELPAHLDRPQIVTRGEGNRLDLAEYAQWAEPLKDNVTRVLADNLSALVPAEQVATYPWKRSAAIKYQVTVDVRRFDAALGQTGNLVANWSVLDKDAGKLLISRKSTLDVPVESTTKAPDGSMDFGPTILAMNMALTQLSEEIAGEIRTLK